jgi:hypothetical protein
MPELNDYSGEFKPDLRERDFSKEALIRLTVVAAKLYMGNAQRAYDIMKNRFGEAMAGELQRELARRAVQTDIRRVRQEMKIGGNDVAAVLKFCQVSPRVAGLTELQCELKNQDHGVLTIGKCLILRYCEKLGDNVLQNLICAVIEPEWFESYANAFNPKIRAVPLKLPPRRSKDDIACKWEFKLQRV